MSKIKDILRFLTLNYPYKDELSKTRLTKLVYLADWYSAIKNKQQMTNIEWYFDHYGPFVSDIYEEAAKDKCLNIKQSYTVYGSPKEVIGFNEQYKKNIKFKLTEDEKTILKKVVEETETLTWNAFINKVYSTYPINGQKRYNYLNLVQLANEMEKDKGALTNTT